jgi:pyridine nucleotide-disulfide oxidoreductase
MSQRTEVAIVGAGPYGLSIAAHLRARGVAFRVFGRPMGTWQRHMPAGMILKSQGFASSLDNPGGSHTLEAFCARTGMGYGEFGVPVPLATFVAYGIAFQREVVPHVEERMVIALDATRDGFALRLDDGEHVDARQVVIAVGMMSFAVVPSELAHLPAEHCSHSSEHHTLDRFAGRDVTVIGAGASALDIATLLAEAGADVRLVARQRAITWMDVPTSGPRSLPARIRRPRSALGLGLRLLFYETAPMLFHRLPAHVRAQLVRTTLGPAGTWCMRDRFTARVPTLLGRVPHGAKIVGKRVLLRLAGDDGTSSTIVTDHVIAATGYRVNVERLTFLSPALRDRMAVADGSPVLSTNFESSVPGLHFAGLAAAHAFGPLMRFVAGARYTARRLSEHVINRRTSANTVRAQVEEPIVVRPAVG